jgi:acetolactate synthase I/II/III large subunit
MERTLAEWMVARLEALGVSTVFGVPGGLCSGLDNAILRSGIRMVIFQHETLAGYAAAGYHRATGLPGVVVVTGGPGALNATSPLAAARLDGDGVIVLAGDVATTDAGRGVLQDGGATGLDLVRVMEPLAGYAVAITRPREGQVAFERALCRATGSQRAPSFLQIPIDLQRQPVATVSLHLKSAATPRLSEMGMTRIVSELDRGPQVTLLVGRRGATAGASAIVDLAEKLAAPFLVDADAMGLMPLDHPLCLGSFGIGDDGLAAAWLRAHPPDPLVTIGARLDDTTTAAFSPSLTGSRVVQLDTVDDAIGRAFHIETAAACDLRSALPLLKSHVAKRSRERYRATVAEIAERKAARQTLPMLPHEHHPLATATALLRAFPKHAVFTSDIGNHLLAMLRGLLVDGGCRFEMSLGLGGMGSGVGLALGMALGGSAPVVCVCGDGTLAMVGNELLTAVKYRIPVTFVVWRDGYLGMVRQGVRRVFGACDDYELRSFDLVAWGRSLGAPAFAVEDEAALLAAAAEPVDGPRLLVVPIDPDIALANPRETVINFAEAAGQ